VNYAIKIRTDPKGCRHAASQNLEEVQNEFPMEFIIGVLPV